MPACSLPALLLRELPPHPSFGSAPLPAWPSVIIGSSSGGNDSHAAVLWARWRWPETPIIIWHALLDEMDWEQTPAALDALADHLCGQRVTVQAVYRIAHQLRRHR